MTSTDIAAFLGRLDEMQAFYKKYKNWHHDKYAAKEMLNAIAVIRLQQTELGELRQSVKDILQMSGRQSSFMTSLPEGARSTLSPSPVRGRRCARRGNDTGR